MDGPWPFFTRCGVGVRFLVELSVHPSSAGAHFVSSIAVVIAYVLLTSIVEIPQPYMRYGAAIALAILAYIFWKERGEDFAYTQHGHFHENDNS